MSDAASFGAFLERLQQAVAAHRDGRLEVAEAVYRQLTAERPDEPDVLHLLGVLRFQRGQLAEGLDLVARAVALQPHTAVYHVNLGRMYAQAGRPTDAVRQYEAALRLDPACDETRDLLREVRANPFTPPPAASTVEEYARLFDMSLRDWLRYHQRHVVLRQCKWMGVPALKNPMDAWIYQELLAEIRPDVLIEIGSAHGGSTLYFAHLMDLLGHGTILSLDIDRSTFAVEHPRIQLFTGDSVSAEIVDGVRAACAGRRTMAIHDGDHRRHAVLTDLRNYGPCVSVGSYFIVEDGIVDLFSPEERFDAFHGPGPFEAVQQFLRETHLFEVDKARERYLATYNPHGFLKRVR